MFYGAMVCEGVIALIWAAAGCSLYEVTDGLNTGLAQALAMGQSKAIYDVCSKTMGGVGIALAMIGVVVCPITSGDTALRSLRLSISDSLHIDQSSKPKRLGLSAIIFALVAVILVFAKSSPQRLQHPMALLRMVQPDPVPVRIPGYLRMDVREQQGQVGVDSPDSRCLVHLCYSDLHCQCTDRLPYSLDARLHHRCLRCCGLRCYHCLVRQEARCPAPEAVSCNYFLKQTRPAKWRDGFFLSQNHAHAC